MSLHSTAPHYRPANNYSPSPVRKERASTYPYRQESVNKSIQPISNLHKDGNKYPLKRQSSHRSSIGSYSSDTKSSLQGRTRNSSISNENGNDKWKKLKAMTDQVNNMKEIVDQLFPSVEIQPDTESTVNYSGLSEYEYQVECLRNVIDEQISRMKAYWCEEESTQRYNSTREDYQIEQLRYNVRDMFKRMKVVVEELVPSVSDRQKLTKCWVEDLTSQLTNLELSIRGFVKSRSSDFSSSQLNSPLTESIPDSFAGLRIKELEEELDAALKREDDLRLKLKLVEQRKEKEIKTIEDQIEELHQMLDRANSRARKYSNEAYSLKLKMTELLTDADLKQLELGISERKRAEMEAELTLRRGEPIKGRAGYMRTSPEYVNRNTPVVAEHNTNVPEHNSNIGLKRSPIPREENIYAQPKPIPVNSLRRMSSLRERRTSSVTSQGSRRVVSPKKVNFWSDSMHEPSHYKAENEYNKLATCNTQPQRFVME